MPVVNLSIAGLNIFINRIEYNTPSGRLALILINTVKKAAPIAKITLPAELVGLVTGSVNMKIAPNITPPVNKWNNGYHNPSPFTKPINNVVTKIVTRYVTGTFQSITLRHTRKAPTKRMTRALVSPIAPAYLPTNISNNPPN